MSQRLDVDAIEALIAMAARNGLGELEWSNGEERICIRRAGPDAVAAPLTQGAGRQPPAAPVPATPDPAQDAGLHRIRAGMHGVFYSAPEPGAPPFAAPGQQISEGQVVGILEAMKTFNQIEADRAGTVISVEATDGTTVAPGDVLFVVRP